MLTPAEGPFINVEVAMTAERAYTAYSAATGNKTHDGKEMPAYRTCLHLLRMLGRQLMIAMECCSLQNSIG